MPLVGALLSFAVTVLFLLALRPVAQAVGLVDVPGGRKRHSATVPVIGGIAMSIGLAFGASLVPHPYAWDAVLVGIYLLVVVGTIDDRFDLPASVRLIAQFCAALLVVFSGLAITHLGEPWFFPLPLGSLSAAVTILFVLALINAFNFIDGLDGLAGGLALISLGAMAAISAGTPLFALVAVVAGTVVGFLLFNFPVTRKRRRRTFMGDAGSTALGLLIAAFGVYLSQGPMARIAPAIGLWLVAVPVFELFSAILRRLVQGRSPFTPDHAHMHHVLVEHGLSQRAALFVMLGMGLAFAVIGLTGDRLAVSDGAMLLLWFAAGTFYYQTLRHPRWFVRLVLALRSPEAEAAVKLSRTRLPVRADDAK